MLAETSTKSQATLSNFVSLKEQRIKCWKLIQTKKEVWHFTKVNWEDACSLSWVIWVKTFTSTVQTTLGDLFIYKEDWTLRFSSFFFFLINLFIFGCVWVFVAVCGLSLVAVSGGYSLLQCAGFSLRWLLLLWSTGSRCAGFSSCGAQLLCGMWDLPGPGIEPVSPALAGGFLTTVPPRKPQFSSF